MAMTSYSEGISFSQLNSRDSSIDWPDDDSDDDKGKRPRRNPFDDVGSSSDFGGMTWISSKEVADFMKTSRGLSLSDDEDGDKLGAPWGGVEYSLVPEKPKSQTGSTVQSARTRSQSSATTTSQHQWLSTSGAAGVRTRTPPARPPAVALQPSSLSTRSSYSLSVPSSSSSSTSQVSAAAVRNRTPVTSEKSVPTKQTALQNASASIQDVISSTPQVSVTEYNRLQKELGQLRAAQKGKSTVLPVEETVKSIMCGQPYTLEGYKSLKAKVSLLEHAIGVHDGNIIMTVVLFMRRTLKQRMFHDEIKKQPKAVQHFCKYLKDHYEHDELTEFYRSLGRFEDAAMLQFEQAIKTKDPNGRLTKLKFILRQYFEGYPQLSEQTAFLKECIELLDHQLLIESADTKAQREGKNHVMVVHPRQASLPLCSVIVTLYYCCRYHFGEPENIFSSPLLIRAKFKLSDKQYEWTALSARANLKQWADIEQMLRAKGWFGSTKMKSVIGFKHVVEVLHQHRAPEKVLNTYLKLIDDQHKRLSLATKLQCHEAVIETLVAMKDRQQLEEYRKQFRRTAPEQAKISEYLNNSQIRWKN